MVFRPGSARRAGVRDSDLAREARVDTAQLSPLEGLTDDQDVLGDDYTTIMRANAAALVEALGCSGASGG